MRRLTAFSTIASLAAFACVTAVTAAPPKGSTDLMITKTAGAGTATVGSNLAYTIGIQNRGPDPATGVTVADCLPREVDFVSATSTVGQCALQGRRVTCAVGSLEFGPSAKTSSATVTLTVAVRRRGTVRNTASVAGDQPDPV